MDYIKQFTRIMLLLFLGYCIEHFLNLTIPGTVIAMIVLFLALLTKKLKIEDVEAVSDFIVKNILLFYIVPAVGIMIYVNLILEEFIAIIIPLTVSILVGLFVAGKVTEILLKIREGKYNG